MGISNRKDNFGKDRNGTKAKLLFEISGYWNYAKREFVVAWEGNVRVLT